HLKPQHADLRGKNWLIEAGHFYSQALPKQNNAAYNLQNHLYLNPRDLLQIFFAKSHKSLVHYSLFYPFSQSRRTTAKKEWFSVSYCASRTLLPEHLRQTSNILWPIFLSHS